LRLKELEIRNFGIIRDASIQFSIGAKVIGLVGRYAADDTGLSSNRVGKTTVAEAIEYILFGKVKSRSHKKIINRSANEGLYLKGVFILDNGEELEIIRERDNKGSSPAVSVNNQFLQWDEAYDYICEIIGYTYEERRNTAYFGQGDIHQFMNATPKEKRGLLLNWLGQTRWEGPASVAAEKVNFYARSTESIGIAIAAIPIPDESVEEIGEAIDDYGEDLIDDKEELVYCEGRLARWNDRGKKLLVRDGRLRDRARYANELDRLNIELGKVDVRVEKKKLYEVEVDKIECDMVLFDGEFRKELDAIDGELARLNAERKGLIEVLDKAKDANGLCPIVNDSCGRVSLAKVEKQYRDMINQLDSEIIGMNSNRSSKLKSYRHTASSMKDSLIGYKDKISKLGNTDREYFEDKIEDVEDSLDEIGEIKPVMYTAELVEEKQNEYLRKCEELRREISSAESRLAVLNEKLRQAKAYDSKREELEGRLQEANKLLGAWKYCVYMFGDRGIPNEFIVNAFADLENDINYILSKICSVLSVEFKPYKVGSTKEKHCVVCGTDFETRKKKCSNCGEERKYKRIEQLVLNIHDSSEGAVSDFDLDSGGGKVLISFAVRIALLLFKIRQNNSQVMPVVFDEIVGMLDLVSRTAVVNVVLGILIEEYGIEQVFWVSHVQDTLENISDTLVVTRHGNHSTVDWN
jgi:DNA repair exonuclease SbcCD ATPase subunit